MASTYSEEKTQAPLTDFDRIMGSGNLAEKTSLPEGPGAKVRFEVDPEAVKNGLGQLVLTLVKLLHELLERQALRRIDGGSLNDDQIEQVGLALMRQAEEIDRLRKEFNLKDEDLNLDLGPLGRLL